MRVVIAEDNVLLSEGLTLLLRRAGFEVAEIVTDADGFVAAVDTHRPDVTVVDVRLPPSFRDEGIRAALRVRQQRPDLPILVLSQYVETVYASRLMAGGGAGIGYLLKDRVARVDEFVDALHRVAAGAWVLDPQVVARPANPLKTLTGREREVLGLMAQGLDNADIAAKLFIVERSVHKHIGSIFNKLGLAVGDSGHRRVRAVLAFLDGARS